MQMYEREEIYESGYFFRKTPPWRSLSEAGAAARVRTLTGAIPRWRRATRANAHLEIAYDS
jgi:hypothetical protein